MLFEELFELYYRVYHQGLGLGDGLKTLSVDYYFKYNK